MSTVVEYNRLRKLGLTRKMAVKANIVEPNIIESLFMSWLFAAILATPLILASKKAHDHFQEQLQREDKLLASNFILQYENGMQKHKIKHLELVVLSCLNNVGIRVEGKDMECLVRDWKI